LDKVFILSILHRHGQDLYASRTYEGAHAALANYCRENWCDQCIVEDMPPEDSELIEAYFDSTPDESWDIDQLDVGA